MTCAVVRIFDNRFRVCPDGLEVVFLDEGAYAFGSECEGVHHAVLRVRCTQGYDVAHAVQLDLVFYREEKLTGDLVARECPVYAAASEARDELLLFVDELRLFVAEEKCVFETKTRCATLPVEGRDDCLVAEGELWEHDRHVFAGRPVEDTRCVWERKGA